MNLNFIKSTWTKTSCIFSVEEDVNEDEDEEGYLEQDDAIDKEEIADVEDNSGIRALIIIDLLRSEECSTCLS